MVRTIIYAVYLIALLGATFLFLIRADGLWQLQKKFKNRMIKSEDEYEEQLHKSAFEHATVDAISWTAIAICGIYACFDCALAMLITL